MSLVEVELSDLLVGMLGQMAASRSFAWAAFVTNAAPCARSSWSPWVVTFG